MDSNAAQTPRTLGELTRQARERAGLSLRNLEAITGISRTMLHRLELDQVDDPSAETLLRLADALELNSDDLFILMGHQPSTDLPSLAPYLRSKYRLPPSALAEASQALRAILEKYGSGRVGRYEWLRSDKHSGEGVWWHGRRPTKSARSSSRCATSCHDDPCS